MALLAAGLGIDPPAMLYKRMVRPLVDEAGALAVEFARRGVGLVVVDSKMFAVAGGEGAAFHEPITAFYAALRLFAPAASLILNHVTNADARSGTPARPYGGAFAFNGPRLIWEAKRDQDITDAIAIVLTCKKANNLARRPEPFGLRFQPGEDCISVYPSHVFRKAARGGGLKDFHFHDLRHHGATMALNAGFTAPIVQALGGWKTERMMRRYAAVTDATLRAAAEAVSGAGSGNGGWKWTANAVKS